MKFTFKSFSGDKNSRQGSATLLKSLKHAGSGLTLLTPPPIGTSANEPPNAQTRRKDQVRRAQKTHRERKEAYTRSLEAEVVQLRANETKILQETRNLYSEITILKKLLTQNGIPIPTIHSAEQVLSESESSEQSAFELTIGQDRRSKNKQQRINVRRHEIARNHRQYTINEKIVQSPEDFDWSNASESYASSSVSPPGAQLAEMTIFDIPRTKLCDTDQTAIGVEFVLSLESPCLEHLAPAPAGSSAATGHSLMVSATLLHHHPAPPEQRLAAKEQPWQISATGIERLLELSSTIPMIDGELTPVQAWDQLRKHPHFEKLELARLERLKDTLVKHVKCYGFGGVIEQGVFNNAIYEAFVVGRVFQ